jgi:hypothetical protein
MMGGREWTIDSVPSVLEQLRFLIPRYNSTNEPIPRQWTQVLDALPSVAPKHADCIMAFIAWLKEKKLLCYTCVGKCTTRCTSRCHDGEVLGCCR